MYAVSAEHLGRREYSVTVEANNKTVKNQFIMPMFNFSKAARRIAEIVETLNVEHDIDVEDISIYTALEEAAERAGQKIYAIACY